MVRVESFLTLAQTNIAPTKPSYCVRCSIIYHWGCFPAEPVVPGASPVVPAHVDAVRFYRQHYQVSTAGGVANVLFYA